MINLYNTKCRLCNAELQSSKESDQRLDCNNCNYYQVYSRIDESHLTEVIKVNQLMFVHWVGTNKNYLYSFSKNDFNQIIEFTEELSDNLIKKTFNKMKMLSIFM